jgi:hypothetical protein
MTKVKSSQKVGGGCDSSEKLLQGTTPNHIGNAAAIAGNSPKHGDLIVGPNPPSCKTRLIPFLIPILVRLPGQKEFSLTPENGRNPKNGTLERLTSRSICVICVRVRKQCIQIGPEEQSTVSPYLVAPYRDIAIGTSAHQPRVTTAPLHLKYTKPFFDIMPSQNFDWHNERISHEIVKYFRMENLDGTII